MIRDLAAELEALLVSDDQTEAPPANVHTRQVPGESETGLAGDDTAAQAQRYLYDAPPLPEAPQGAAPADVASEQPAANVAAVQPVEGDSHRPLRGAETQGRIAEMLAARQAERLRRNPFPAAAPANAEPEYAPVPENWGRTDSNWEETPQSFPDDDGWTSIAPHPDTPAAAAPYALDGKRTARPGVRRVVFSAASVFVLLAASAVAGQYVIGIDEGPGSPDPHAPAAADADEVALAGKPDEEDDSAADQQAGDDPQRVDMAGAAATWDEPSEARTVDSAAAGSSTSAIGSAQAAESDSDIRNVTPQGSRESEDGDPAIPSAEEALTQEQGTQMDTAASEAGPEAPADTQDAAETGEGGTASEAADSFGQSEPDPEESAAPDAEPAGSDAESAGLNSAVGPATLARVTTHVNMRDAPDNEGEVITVIPADADVDLVDCEIWCEVVYDGQQGWVYEDFVETGESVSTADS